MYGFLEVNKVAGNFHFAPGKSFQQSSVHVHDILTFQKDSFNVRYYIHAWMSDLISETSKVFSDELFYHAAYVHLCICWWTRWFTCYILSQISHKINRLTFGDYFPGVVNPLDGYFFRHCCSFTWFQFSMVFFFHLAVLPSVSALSTIFLLTMAKLQTFLETMLNFD